MSSSPECSSTNTFNLITPIKKELFEPEINDEQHEEKHVDPFPWVQEFRQECLSKIGRLNLESLVKLMVRFHKMITPSVHDSYRRPNRATKLKTIIADTLMFFHMTYSDLSFTLGSSAYKEVLAEIMVMYVDMELKASSTRRESERKIASQIISALLIYFGDKSKYSLDIMLKAKMISKDSSLICGLLFQRILWDIPNPVFDTFTYLRYLLVFKRWKSIVCSQEERETINMLAIQKLKPPPNLKEKIAELSLKFIFPKISDSCTEITALLMKCKIFSKESVKAFYKALSASGFAYYDWPTEAVKISKKECPSENKQEDNYYGILTKASIKKMLGEEVKPPYAFTYRRNKKNASHENEVVVVLSDEEDENTISSSLPFKMNYDIFLSNFDDSLPLISSSDWVCIEPKISQSSLDFKKRSMGIDCLRDETDFNLNFTDLADLEEFSNFDSPVSDKYSCDALISDDPSTNHVNHSMEFTDSLEKPLSMESFTIPEEKRTLKLAPQDNFLNRLGLLGVPHEKDKLINVVPPFNKDINLFKTPTELVEDFSSDKSSIHSTSTSDAVQSLSIASEEPKTKKARRTRKRNS